MDILTISEAAEHFGVTETTLRKWVMRGYLEPLRRGTKPLRFRLLDVDECRRARMSKAERARRDTLADEFLAMCRGDLSR